jgi:peptidase M48-like protein
MSFLVFGAAMVLTAFLAVNAAASVAVIAAAPLVSAGLRAGWLRSRGLLALRLLPAGAALAIAGGVVLPAYVLLEPVNAGERVSLRLFAIVLAALALVAGGVVRGARGVAATAALVRGWSTDATPIRLPHWPWPAFRVRDGRPIFAVVGLRRPRIYVAGQVLDALSAPEVAAAAAHERAHLAAGDNLKRLLLRSAPDLLGFSDMGRRLEREWARLVEAEADDRAARRRPALALALAAGLVKVARLAPRRGPALPVSALHEGGDVEARVRWLVGLAGQERPRAQRPRREGGRALVRAGAALAFLAAAAAVVAHNLPAVHRLVESMARLLA